MWTMNKDYRVTRQKPDEISQKGNIYNDIEKKYTGDEFVHTTNPMMHIRLEQKEHTK